MTDVVATSSAAIDVALGAWSQGDCVVGAQWFVFRRNHDENGLEELAVEGFVVVTQSCDVVRSAERRPVVEVSPLVKIADAARLEDIRRGRLLQYAFVPGVSAKGEMIDETYAVFAAWDFARSKRENLDRLRDENFIGASRATWLKPLRSPTEPLQAAKNNGAKRALTPIENKRNFLDVSADIMEHVASIFFGNPKTAAMEVLELT